MTDFPKLTRMKADDENMEKIHLAARKGQTEEVQRLIEIGVDPCIPNRFGCTALHLACKFGQSDTAKYLASISDVQTSWHGQKPIHLAVIANKLDLVKALIDGYMSRGKSVDALLNECDDMEITEIGTHFKHIKGQTALHWCVGLGPEYLAMLKLLVECGASPTAKDRDNETPLMRAMEFQWDEAVEIMLNGQGSGSLRLDYQDKEGRSHIHWAVLANHEDYALRFIELGHDLNMEDNEHNAAVFMAIRGAMPTLSKTMLAGCDPFLVQNAPFHNGTTVFPERITWLDYVGADKEWEEKKRECIHHLQKRLDDIIASLDDGTKKKKRKPSVKRMKLAPSAPMRGRSKSKTR
eukprot:gene810-451_t